MSPHLKRLERRQWRQVNLLRDGSGEYEVSPQDFEAFLEDARKTGLPFFGKYGPVVIRPRKKGKRK